MRLISSLFRLAFHLLYHQFAWAYDLVAALVSLGRWNDWVLAALPHLDGRVLELGYGPGHLQVSLHQKGAMPFGLDESRAMARQASRCLRKSGLNSRLSRGYAQDLPFRAGAFDCAVATFPSEYIFEEHTLREIQRVLAANGKLVVIPVAWQTGESLPARLMNWLLRSSGNAQALETAIRTMEAHFRRGGFEVRYETVEVRHSRVLVFVARTQ